MFIRNFTSLIFLAVYCLTVRAVKVSEAEQIALESSGKLLPPPTLVERVERDLKAIRTKYPEENIGHSPKWEPGQLIYIDATVEMLDKINDSKYGPIKSREMGGENTYLLTFKKPYNPERLAEVLQQELGITGTMEPDSFFGGSSSITLTCDRSRENTYVFYSGSGDCQAGCIEKRYVTFTVGPEEDSVELVSISDHGGSGEYGPTPGDYGWWGCWNYDK